MFHDIHDIDTSGWAVSAFIWIVSVGGYFAIFTFVSALYAWLWLGVSSISLFSLHLLYHYKVYKANPKNNNS